MKTSFQDNDIIDYVNPSPTDAIESGQVVVVGRKVYISQSKILPGEMGALIGEGIHILPKKAATAMEAGAVAIWDEDPGEITNVVADGKFAGRVAYAAKSSDEYVKVLLLDAGPEVANIAAIATADGSDAGTTQTLANANKAKINAILAALKAAGIMAADA